MPDTPGVSDADSQLVTDRSWSPPTATQSSPPDEPKAARRSFVVLTVLLVAIGVAGAVALSVSLPFHVDESIVVPGLLLTLAFLFAEQLAINADVRSGVSWTISFMEIPLVIGLLVAPFPVVLAAHLIAGAGTLFIRRAHRLTFNSGVMVIEIVAAFAVMTAVDDLLHGFGPSWAGVFIGVLAATMVSTLLGLVALRVLGRTMRSGPAARLFARTQVLGVVNTSVGLVGYQVAVHADNGWLLVGLAMCGLAALYVAYAGMLREQRDLETLGDVSLIVARAGHEAAVRPALTTDELDVAGDDEWQVIADRIRDQIGAARVVLRLKFDQQAPMYTVVSGAELPDDLYTVEASGSRADPLLRVPGVTVRHFRIGDAAPDVRHALQRRGVEEALVVPLRGASHLLGVVEAHDKLSFWRGFGQADQRMIGTVASHLATAMDNRRLLGTLRHDAYHDPLTGLLNRPGLRQAATLPREDDTSTNADVVVLRIELDVPPTVSDALGYAWSDRMIVAAGRRLRDALGSEVPLARLESGSFAALLHGTDKEQANRIADRLRRKLAEPYPVDRLSVDAASVVGFASADDDLPVAPDVDTLLQRADIAVRVARASGDSVRGYLPTMGQIYLRRFQMVTQFRHAVEAGQVQVHYQPKVALPSRQLLGVEALVRWPHPEFGPLDPDEFVPAVEAAGLVDVLTDFVLDQALIRVRKWLDLGLRISAAVNLSVRSLEDTDFPDRVAASLGRREVPAELLTFELTESGVMADPQRSLPVLRRLHALGVVLAVDDFGTGYSSLAYLRQLPVDEVKIDKSFVLGMATDLGDLAVVRSIVELGHSLGLTVVAEGVEEDAARDQLVEMGCDVAQGYLISRPLSESRLEAWIQARTARTRDVRDEAVLTLLS